MTQQQTQGEAQTQNARGEWVPAIPLPYMFWLGVPYTECGVCHKRFVGPVRGRALHRYEEHYALHHILKPAAPNKPNLAKLKAARDREVRGRGIIDHDPQG